MLLHLDPANKTAFILSIPRDLFLPIPGTYNANRVDSALNAGPQRLVQTIEDDLGIPINHYVELNFDTFQNVVNALGGLDMYFPDPVKDAYSGLNITTPGCQHLNGTQALAVVRARHMYYYQNGQWNYDPTGDLGRIKRDHEFLRILASQVRQRGLSNPLTANAIVGSVLPDLKVDSGFSLSDMVHLVLTFHSVNPASIPTDTLSVVIDPNSYYYKGANYGDVVFPAQPFDQQTIDQFLGLSAPPGSGISPSSVSVQVLNGTGTPGQAAQTASQLQALGFNVSGTGNSTPVGPVFNETTIYYPKGEIAQAELLESKLGGQVIIGEAPPGAGTNLTLVTGTTFTVASPSSGSSASSTSSTSSSTSGSGSSSASPGQPSYTGPAATEPVTPLPSFDPRSCAANGKAGP
ncbi:MAG: LCP family protein [Actinobacteria bacterium]|nr:LCP family protein [Actinomycetota bacterium]